MISEGDIFLFKFPLTNQSTGKRRPAVLLKKIPGQISDWLVCMVSSRLHHEVQGVDMAVRADEEIFGQSGFRKDSLIRVTRLAVVDEAILENKNRQFTSGCLIRFERQVGGLADILLVVNF